MRKAVLLILLFTGCVSAKNFEKLSLQVGHLKQGQAFQQADLSELRGLIYADDKVRQQNNRLFEKISALLLEHGKKISGIIAEIVKIGAQIKKLEWQNQLRVAQVAILEKQMKDLCARLRKRLKRQDICDEILEQEKTDNQKLLDKFNKEMKERGKKKGGK